MSLLLLIYDVHVKPFEQPLLNKLEFFNELSILVAAYHLPLFTDFVDDRTTHYFAGWSLILFVICNILVNLTVMFKRTLAENKPKLLAFLKRARLWFQKKEKISSVKQENISNE